MIGFIQYISESVRLQLVRGKGEDILKMWNKGDTKWVEVRGKPNFEIRFDKNDPLHKTINALGKSVNISDLVNGEIVNINSKHPHGKKAIKTIKGLMK